jgi:hypothetical protein
MDKLLKDIRYLLLERTYSSETRLVVFVMLALLGTLIEGMLGFILCFGAGWVLAGVLLGNRKTLL